MLPSLTMSTQTKDPTYVRAPIDKIGWIGLWIRHRLLDYILIGTPVLLVLQKYRTSFRTKVMKCCSFMGMEDFFTPLILLLCWIVDARLGRLFCVLLGCGFYLSSFFKCLFCLPRPPSPPINPVNPENKDWALPSNHGIMGVLMPWYLWFYSSVHYQMPPTARILLFVVILLWSSGVMLSRLYLGVHSPADLVAGGIIGVSFLSFYIVTDDYIDYYTRTAVVAPLQLIVLVSILLWIHPRSNPETQSYGESVIVVCFAFGVMLSQTLKFSRFDPTIRLALLENPDLTDRGLIPVILCGLTRVAVGVAAVLLSRIVLKPLLRRIFGQIYSTWNLPVYSFSEMCKRELPPTKFHHSDFKLPPIQRVSVKDGAAPARHVKTNSDVAVKADSIDAPLPYDLDLPMRWCIYTFLGWFVGEGAPLVFKRFGI